MSCTFDIKCHHFLRLFHNRVALCVYVYIHVHIYSVASRFNGLCLSSISRFIIKYHGWLPSEDRLNLKQQHSTVSSLFDMISPFVFPTKKSSLGQRFRSPVGNGVYLETEVVRHTQYNLSLWKSIWHKSICRPSWAKLPMANITSMHFNEVGFDGWCWLTGWRGGQKKKVWWPTCHYFIRVTRQNDEKAPPKVRLPYRQERRKTGKTFLPLFHAVDCLCFLIFFFFFGFSLVRLSSAKWNDYRTIDVRVIGAPPSHRWRFHVTLHNSVATVAVLPRKLDWASQVESGRFFRNWNFSYSLNGSVQSSPLCVCVDRVIFPLFPERIQPLLRHERNRNSN